MGRSNPNSRSSELTDPMRRSFSGNPFPKPSLIPNPRAFPSANTPSDFQRRNSAGGREVAGSFFHDLDDKENGKDKILKPSKARSPATTSKNAKNFMSPTISASSKVTGSPRKKVLVERNEPARTSVPSTTPEAKTPTIRKVTFAEPLQCSSDFKSENGVEQQNFVDLSFDGVPVEEMRVATSLSCEELSGESLVFDMNVPFNAKNETESSFDTVAYEPDCVILDPSFKFSPTPTPPPPVSSTSSIVAPLDADPLMPPYDPKTNYLSPRPQFLHYRPKPRTELYNDRELGDNIMDGSFSDTEVTEDTQSEGSQKSGDVSSDEVIEEEAGISEPARTSSAAETVEARAVAKACFFMRSIAIIALLLLFSFAFISVSVTNSSVMDHPVFFQDFYRVYESSDFSKFAKANFVQFSEFAKAIFDWSARNFHTLFTKSLSSISELISNARGLRNSGHLQCYNLTVLHEYNAFDQEPIFNSAAKDIVETPEVCPVVLNNEESDTALEIDTDEDFGDISEEDYEPVYGEQVQQDMGVTTAVENAPEPEEVLEGQPATVIESDQPLQLAEVSEPNHPPEVVTDLNDQPSLDAKAADIHSEVLKNGDLEVKKAQQECDAKVNVDEYGDVGLKGQPDVAEILTEAYRDDDMELAEAEGESTSIDAAIEDNEPTSEAIDFVPHMMLYLLPIGGTILIARAAFKWLRKGENRSTRVTGCVEQPVFAKAAFHAKEEPSLRNGPTEIDMHGESLCPSEMSSIQKSSYNRQKVMKELNEVHSLEKKPKKRRESLASSSDYSMSSPSYGSFTTYEKIQIKNVCGDEETITPVRRSSRIRSQATSPL